MTIPADDGYASWGDEGYRTRSWDVQAVRSDRITVTSRNTYTLVSEHSGCCVLYAG